MLFKVRYRKKHIYTVYFVKPGIVSANDAMFLVFEKNEKTWMWLVAGECEPIEE